MFFSQVVSQEDLKNITEAAALFFILGMLFCALGIVCFFFIGWWLTNRPGSVSPYSKMKMALGEDLSFEAVREIYIFLESFSQKEGNDLFDVKKASVCRETGRVFPATVGIFNVIKIPSDFLSKRYSGKYVSWGSLSSSQKDEVLLEHEEIGAYQLESSSLEPLPKNVEKKYALMKPGPLYVDLETKTLLGWQCIPNTDLEVLVVQRSKYRKKYD